MQYQDPLYGSWQLPESIERLLLTDRVVRMHGISQSIILNRWRPYGPIPSRIEHGLGVARVAREVITRGGNTLDEHFKLLLPVAGLLHDGGSPPFSHLSEPFLDKDMKHDGESFLTPMLRGSETERVLEDLGLTVDEVTALVAGTHRPLSEILNGSLDIDNIDNVGRYYAAGLHKKMPYNPLALAGAYSYDPVDQAWILSDSCRSEALAWQKCREEMYTFIYTHPNWAPPMMLQRAIYLHHKKAGLPKEFYFMTDQEGATWLALSKVYGVRQILRHLEAKHWYIEAFSYDTRPCCEGPTDKLRAAAADSLFRQRLSDDIAWALGVSKYLVCAAVEVGRDRRKVTLSFRQPDGTVVTSDQGDSDPIWRIRVWIAMSVLFETENKVRNAVAQIVREQLL